jgi:hypothetical protein
MIPARQGFGTDNTTRFNINLRLKIGFQFTIFNSTFKLRQGNGVEHYQGTFLLNLMQQIEQLTRLCRR